MSTPSEENETPAGHDSALPQQRTKEAVQFASGDEENVCELSGAGIDVITTAHPSPAEKAAAIDRKRECLVDVGTTSVRRDSQFIDTLGLDGLLGIDQVTDPARHGRGKGPPMGRDRPRRYGRPEEEMTARGTPRVRRRKRSRDELGGDPHAEENMFDVKLGARVPRELRDEFVRVVKKKGITQTAALTQAIENYIDSLEVD